MKLFVMRHAQASFNAVTDRDRPITENGIDQTKGLLSRYRESFVQVNQLWSSDLLRARQTAGLVSEVIDVPALEKSFLSPDGEIKTVLAELGRLPKETCLMLVSHQPLVGELVSTLVYGNTHQAHPYATSEILELELDFVASGMASVTKQYLPN